MAFLALDAASSWDAHERSCDRNVRVLGGDLISAQVGAAQQGKTENLVFNEFCLHDYAPQVQFLCGNSIFFEGLRQT